MIAAVAARKWPVAHRDELVRLGMTPSMIKRRTARGQLHRIFGCVYAAGRRDLPLRARLHAALLAAGPGSFISHWTAAADRRLLKRFPPVIHVTVPGSGTPRSQPGLIIHRTRAVDRHDVTAYYGLRVATVPRILVDLAPLERPRALEEMIRNAVHAQALRQVDVFRAIRRHRRKPGIAMLNAAMARYDPEARDRRSELERSFQAHQRSDPRLPIPEYNREIPPWEIDVAFHEQRLALELDGRPYHIAVQDFEKDRRKDRKLLQLGWTPVRVGDFEWEWARDEVLQDLYALLGV